MPWVRGQSGNPRGRPSFHEALQRELGGFGVGPDGKRERKTVALVRVAIAKALAGDMRALEWLADRLDGKAAQSLQVSGVGGRSLTVVLKEDEDVP